MSDDEITSYRVLRRRLYFAGLINTTDADEEALYSALRNLPDQGIETLWRYVGADGVLAARQILDRHADDRP